MSWLGLVRLRRPWEQRARDGRVAFIFGVALCARRTREAVRSAAHGPAHPVDGSRPRSRARRVYPHGESSIARAGMAIRSHAHAHARCPLPAVLTLFATHLRSPSARHLEPCRPPWWPWRSLVCRCGWAVHACVLRTVCDARVHGLRSDRCRCRICTHDIPGDARAELGSIYELRYVPGCFEHVMTHRNR